MFKPKFNITPKTNKALVEIERVRGFLLVINERINNEQCQKLCGSIRRTATRDLSSLVQKGLLVMKGELKGAYYVLSPTLPKYRTL